MAKKNKKRKFCPYCQAKQRLIEKLESQLWAYEAKKVQAWSKPLT
jgi:hypothetical protein